MADKIWDHDILYEMIENEIDKDSDGNPYGSGGIYYDFNGTPIEDIIAFEDAHAKGGGGGGQTSGSSVPLANRSGLAYNQNNELTIKIDPDEANGLGLTDDGLKLDTATPSDDGSGQNGALLSTDKSQIDKNHTDNMTDEEMASWFFDDENNG